MVGTLEPVTLPLGPSSPAFSMARAAEWPAPQPTPQAGPKPALCTCPEPTGPQSEPAWGSSKSLRGLSCWVIRGPSMLSPAMKSPGWQAGLRDRAQPPGGEWEGAERESAAHSPGLAFSLWQQEEGEPQGRVKTHVHVVHGLGGHAEVTKAVLLGRVILVGPQEVLQEALLLHGLTDGLKFLQGDSAEGLGSGQGLPLSCCTSNIPISLSIPNCLPQAPCRSVPGVCRLYVSVSLFLYFCLSLWLSLALSPSASLFLPLSFSFLENSSQNLLQDSEDSYLHPGLPQPHPMGRHPTLVLHSQIPHKLFPRKGRGTLDITLCRIYVVCLFWPCFVSCWIFVP